MLNLLHLSLVVSFTLLCFLVISPAVCWGQFVFYVASDQRWFAGSDIFNQDYYFRGVAKAIKLQGPGAFLFSAGDIDPPADSLWTLREYISPSYQWFPAVGNHDLPGDGTEAYYGANMEWLRQFDYDNNGPGLSPNIVRQGPSGCPETTYSLDHENSHFVVINEYCNQYGDYHSEGDISDHLYNWLAKDLAANSKDYVFVIGHEPAYPQPDVENGRFRHNDDSLNVSTANRDRFWSLLNREGVVAYICGHTHNNSAVRIGNVWQIDSGQAGGLRDVNAPSTFIRFIVSDRSVRMKTYRDIHDG